MAWIPILIILAIVATCLFKYNSKDILHRDWSFIVGAFIAAAIPIASFWLILTRVGYSQFEKEYAIRKSYIEQYQPIDGVTYIADITTMNDKLIDWQFDYTYWGKFSVVPSRVMDITPIGVKGE
jgi:hypothetical protein